MVLSCVSSGVTSVGNSSNIFLEMPPDNKIIPDLFCLESIQIRMEQLSAELDSLRNQRLRNEQEVASMENLALKQRFQEIVDNLSQEIMEKEMEVGWTKA